MITKRSKKDTVILFLNNIIELIQILFIFLFTWYILKLLIDLFTGYINNIWYFIVYMIINSPGVLVTGTILFLLIHVRNVIKFNVVPLKKIKVAPVAMTGLIYSFYFFWIVCWIESIINYRATNGFAALLFIGTIITFFWSKVIIKLSDKVVVNELMNSKFNFIGFSKMLIFKKTLLIGIIIGIIWFILKNIPYGK